MTPHEFINQAAHITPKSESLEADGAITIYSTGSSRVVAQYEGLEVHEAMQENAALRERVAALEADLFDRMGDARIADLHFDYGNSTIAAFDFDGELVAEAETLERVFELATAEGDE